MSRVATCRAGSAALRGLLGITLLLGALAAASPSGAAAEAPSVPYWNIEARPAPTNLPPDGEAMIVVTASNIGDAEATGETEITDSLPEGVTVKAVQTTSSGTSRASGPGRTGYPCSKKSGREVACTYTGTLPAYEQLELQIRVHVETSALSLVNEATVSGGGAPTAAQSKKALRVSANQTEFGVEAYALTPENEEFEPDHQAGSHPFQLTTAFELNERFAAQTKDQKEPLPAAAGLQRNLAFKLPPGLIGNVNAVAQCSDVAFGVNLPNNVNLCPNNTAVGVATVTVFIAGTISYSTGSQPIFNLVPAPGEPARFGFTVDHVPIILDTSVRTGAGYGVTVSVNNASAAVQVLGSRVTFWGEPGDPRHNEDRGWACFLDGLPSYREEHPCEPAAKLTETPLLTLPTACGPLESTVEGEGWEGNKLVNSEGALVVPGAEPTDLEGCEALPFHPSLAVAPETERASTPTGLNVAIGLPQPGLVEPGYEGKAAQVPERTRLLLPPGVQASPALASAISTCSVLQAGYNGPEQDGESTLAGDLALQSFAPFAVNEPPTVETCPHEAEIGTVNIKTPVLERELVGGLYLAYQDTNPFKSPLVMYVIAAEEPLVAGEQPKVVVKLAGEVKITPAGELISEFNNTPDTPFETFAVHLMGGQRAAQSTPAFCGTEYKATAEFTTWASAKGPGEQQSPVYSNPAEFKISSGPNGTPCPGATLPFKPEFQAGSTNATAGAYTPFTLTIEKPDGQQALQAITTQLPPGLAGKIAAVTPCAATQAIEALPMPSPNPPPCGPESLIGHITTESGLGGKPVTLPGNLYLTKGVDGAPFGLLASTDAKAGPFNVGWVNVLSTISVNEETAAVTTKTITPIPKLLDGVPVQLKAINVTVERPGNAPFQFNPTNCSPLEVTGSLNGWEQAFTVPASHFQATGCGSLGFLPDFKAYTEGHTSKEGGASLRVRINYPPGAYANIAKSVTYLPYDLPSRLKPTIQHACPDYDFNPNALQNCDPLSLVGHAIVHTPVFKNPLEGPAYLVSHANRSFPDIDIILTEPESGVKIVLDGHTDIKKGITKTSFENVPDAPVETFELILPEGPHSALAANGNLCDETKTTTTTKHVTRKVKGKTEHVTVKVKTTVPEKLVLPTTLTAQNGAVIEQPTPIVVEGCPKAAVKSSKTTKKPAKKPKKKK